jgi:cytochrome c553
MKKILVLLYIVGFAGFAMAQSYTNSTGITGVDKLGAHQNGGRGCVGCHAPHSGARGNGGNAAAGGAVTDPETGNFALWGEDLGPLYSQTLAFGDEGSFPITLPGSSIRPSAENEALLTGVVMCLSCHDGNIAKGAMMTNQSYEQARGLLPATYGPRAIPTLLGNDGTAAGNYQNDHPIGPLATLGAVGVASNLLYSAGGCLDSGGNAVDCLQPNPAKASFIAFYDHYGAFNITQKTDARSTSLTGGAYPSGGRTSGVVMPDTNPANAYLVCTTCHTPHTMYTFSGYAAKVKGVYPSYFFITAPYNPGAPVTNPTTASSATQFCRQCHFTGAGGSNEGSGIMGVTTQF